jgi:hypothetical protein
MYETMDENFLPCDDYLLKFSERWLLLRRNEGALLLVLGGEKANLASTRMVTNMTLKHLTPEVLAQLGLGDSAKAIPLPVATQGAAAAPAGATGGGLAGPEAKVAATTTVQAGKTGSSFFGFMSLGRTKDAKAEPTLEQKLEEETKAGAVSAEPGQEAPPERPVRMYRGRAY